MNDEIHLKNYLRIILKRKYTVVTVIIVALVIALMGILNYTPVYTASTKLLIEKNEGPPLMMNYGYGGVYDPEFVATQSQIIKSERVSRKVVQALDLENTYAAYFRKHPDVTTNPLAWFKELYGTILKTAGIEKVAPDDPLAWIKKLYGKILKTAGIGKIASDDQNREANPNGDPIVDTGTISEKYSKMISNGLFIEPLEESDIISISYSSTSPQFSKNIVNSVANAYVEETFEMKMAASRQAIAWMTEKAEKERSKLETSEKALQNYMRDKDMVTIEDRIAITPERLTEISTQLTKAEVKRKELQALNEKVNQVVSKNLEDAETINVIASDATLQAIHSQMMETDQKITELSKKYGPKHPVIKRARADAARLEVKRKKEIKRIILSINNEFELARSSENNLRELLEKTKLEAAELNEKNIEHGILKREIETNRNLYDALLTRIKEQSITDQAQTVNIWIVEEAKSPKFPSNQRNKQKMILGLLIGLFGGIGLAFFLEYLDQTVKSPDDIEKRFGLSVLGVVPLLKSGKLSLEKMSIDEPSFPFSESYRTIRTAILLSTPETAPKNLLITSASPKEGKTVTAINLAITLAAQSSTRVLLVDADLRRPRIHSVFDLNGEFGLSTFLTGASEQVILRGTPVANLSVIPAGPIPPNPSELLGAPRMTKFIDSLREKFDFIVMDSPPLLSVTDALLLSKIADGTIVVIRSGKLSYEIVRRGVKSLKEVNSRIIGSVLNAVDVKKKGYYDYGYKYYKDYYYKASY
jgi:capsular exopolysaccharide synthesis family protein